MLLSVCLTPSLIHLYDVRTSIVVIIDIFRATSSICYGIDNGADAIIPVASVESCLSYSSSDYLLAAERDGSVVKGFNFGNSPFAYTREKVEGKTVVLTTTNGTHAINESREAKRIVIGSFLNMTVLCKWLADQEENIILLCAGWKGKFNLEDTLFAGAVVHHLKDSGFVTDDSGLAAADLYSIAKDNLSGYMKKTSHSERLKKLKIEEDIEFCLNVDITSSIPVLEGDRLVRMA